MKSMDNRQRTPEIKGSSVLLVSTALGRVGWGGSVGFADPDDGVRFSPVRNGT